MLVILSCMYVYKHSDFTVEKIRLCQIKFIITVFLSSGENLGLESKYLKKREDSIPLRGLSQNLFNNPGEKTFLK